MNLDIVHPTSPHPFDVEPSVHVVTVPPLEECAGQVTRGHLGSLGSMDSWDNLLRDNLLWDDFLWDDLLGYL